MVQSTTVYLKGTSYRVKPSVGLSVAVLSLSTLDLLQGSSGLLCSIYREEGGCSHRCRPDTNEPCTGLLFL